jgi:hypothetical protein
MACHSSAIRYQYIQDNTALCKLDISSCQLNAEGGKALAVGLKSNQVMTELNIAGNELWVDTFDDPLRHLEVGQLFLGGVDTLEGVDALVDVISGMGALVSLNIKNNGIAGSTPEFWLKVWVHSLSPRTAFGIVAVLVAVAVWLCRKACDCTQAVYSIVDGWGPFPPRQDGQLTEDIINERTDIMNEIVALSFQLCLGPGIVEIWGPRPLLVFMFVGLLAHAYLLAIVAHDLLKRR